MSAVVLQLPEKTQRAAKRRMNRAELDARHSWMMENSHKWETTDTDGVKYRDAIVHQLVRLMRERWSDEFPPLTAARMRKDIVDGRKLIEKRNRVKDWVESLGADLDAFGTVNPAEQALFFVFDNAQA